MAEDRVHNDPQAIVEELTRQLNEALAKVDRLSADLAKERSLHDLLPLPHPPSRPRHPASPRLLVPPSHVRLGHEIMADTTLPQRSHAQSRHSDHSRHHRSESRSSRGSRRS